MRAPLGSLAVALLSLSAGSNADALVVTTLHDQLDVPAGPELSLREALRDSSSGEIITFEPTLSGGTLVLGGSQLEIPTNLTVDASALPGGIIINANGLSRALEVPSDISTTLNNITITGGFLVEQGDSYDLYGAGIRSDGTLHLIRCTLNGNNSSARGGAIYHRGPIITLTECTFSNNQAFKGGGLFLYQGSATVRSCTFARNETTNGGGIHSDLGTLLVENSTFGNNVSSSGGGLFLDWSTVELRHCTILGNQVLQGGGGIKLDDTSLTLEGCVIASNVAQYSSQIEKRNGNTISSVGTNLISINSTVETEFPASALVGVSAAPIDPLLSPPGDFGGPTRTLFPLSGSPIIDSGISSPTTPAADQRGGPRTLGAHPDLGAVEIDPSLPTVFPPDGTTLLGKELGTLAWGLQRDADIYEVFFGTDRDSLQSVGTASVGRIALPELDLSQTYFWRVDATAINGVTTGDTYSFATRPPFTVTTPEDTVDPADGELSLREAISASNAFHGFDFIQFASSLEGSTIAITRQLEISSPLTLDATMLASRLTISGNNQTRLFQVYPDQEVLMKGMDLVEGFIEPSRDGLQNDPLYRGRGGALCNFGNVILEEMVFRNNVSEGGGGAVYGFPSGSLTIRSSTFVNNRAVGGGGAIDNRGGELSITDSILSENSSYGGGALFNSTGDTTTIIERSTISNNRSFGEGGGITSHSSLTINESTISLNRAELRGGGILNGSSLNLTNSTVANNIAGERGGGIENAADLNLINVTVSFNRASIAGGGIHYPVATGSLEIQESIVAGNTTLSAASDIDKHSIAPLTQSGENLIGSNESVEIHFPEGLLAGTTAAPLNPILSPLGTYGGPTQTCIPLAGSPARDAGISGLGNRPPTDQRGNARPAGTAPDLGAVELGTTEIFAHPLDGATLLSPDLNSLSWPAVNNAESYEVYFGTDEAALASIGITSDLFLLLPALDYGVTYFWRVDSTEQGITTQGPLFAFSTRPSYEVTAAQDVTDPGDGVLSLREAIALTNGLGGSNQITFSSSLNGHAIPLTQGKLYIDSSLTVDASALADGLTLSGENQSRVFEIGIGTIVSLRGLTISGGRARPTVFNGEIGGGILSHGISLHLKDCIISNNFANESGGGLYDESSILNLENTVFTLNSSQDQGGGLFSVADQVEITGSTFSDNNASFGGGGISLDSGVHSLRQSVFSQNCAGRSGGAVSLGRNSQNTIEGSTFTGNKGGSLGGAIFDDGRSTITGSVILNNEAPEGGGGSFRSGTFLNCVFKGNRATHGDGGAIFGFITLGTNLVVEGNTAAKNGGGIYATFPCVLIDTKIANNSAVRSGGGLFAAKECELTSCSIIRNGCSGDQGSSGGGGFICERDLHLTNSTVAQNYSGNSGGGFFARRNVTISSCTVAENVARTLGGGILHDGDSLALSYSTIARNSATWGGGVNLDGGTEFTIENSIIAANSSLRDGPDIYTPQSTVITLLGDLLLGNNQTVRFQLPSGPLIGSPGSEIDPMLARLGHYGGMSQTTPPLSNSLAVNHATSSPNLPSTDQRGEARTIGAFPDLGAIEIDHNQFSIPLDGQSDIPLDIHLSWPAQPGVGTYQVFLGSSPEALLLIGTTAEPNLSLPTPLVPGVQYYWRVDFNDGVSVLTGDVRSFISRAAIEVIAMQFLPDQSFLLQWHSIPGREYTIMISEDLSQWAPIPQGVQATSSKSEWIDNGPPAGTPSPPNEEEKRYYTIQERLP